MAASIEKAREICKKEVGGWEGTMYGLLHLW